MRRDNCFYEAFLRAQKDYETSTDPDLGKVSDNLMARRHKIHHRRVGRIRRRLGVGGWRGRGGDTEVLITKHHAGEIDLQFMSSRQVSDTLGREYTQGVVGWARKKLGIKFIGMGGTTPERIKKETEHRDTARMFRSVGWA